MSRPCYQVHAVNGAGGWTVHVDGVGSARVDYLFQVEEAAQQLVQEASGLTPDAFELDVRLEFDLATSRRRRSSGAGSWMASRRPG